MYADATIATYSHACRAMNSSVPPVSPPLIAAAATRIPTTTPTIAQNSVVLNAALVSVLSRRATPLRPRSAAPVRTLADSIDSSLVDLTRDPPPKCIRNGCPRASGYWVVAVPVRSQNLVGTRAPDDPAGQVRRVKRPAPQIPGRVARGGEGGNGHEPLGELMALRSEDVDLANGV